MADLLLVDDDPELTGLLADLLEGAGHTVRVARDGEEGLLLVAARHPDLVLLDVEMPRITGPEMSHRMHMHDVGAEGILIVLLSGVPNLANIASRVGTPYFLAKPFEFDSVLRLVARVMHERQAPTPMTGRGSV